MIIKNGSLLHKKYKENSLKPVVAEVRSLNFHHHLTDHCDIGNSIKGDTELKVILIYLYDFSLKAPNFKHITRG